MSYYSMDWTNEKVLQLISEYKARTELWDRNDVNYKNRMRKLKAWEDIASVLGLSRFEVERKFRILLVQYRREKARILKLTASSGDRRPKSDCSSWYAFKAFDFWNDRYKLGRTSGEYDNDTMCNFNDTEYAEVKIEPTSVEFESCYLEDDVKDDYIDEVGETAISGSKLQSDGEPVPKRRKSTNSETDEIDLFMAYVAAEIRNLKSADVKRKLKRRILRALLEAGDEDDDDDSAKQQER